jgi:hypothetical protein
VSDPAAHQLLHLLPLFACLFAATEQVWTRIDLLQALENDGPGTRNKIWHIPSAGVPMMLQILFSNGSLPWPGPPTMELLLYISLRLGLYLSNWPFLDSSGPSMDVSADASQLIFEYFVLDLMFRSRFHGCTPAGPRWYSTLDSPKLRPEASRTSMSPISHL